MYLVRNKITGLYKVTETITPSLEKVCDWDNSKNDFKFAAMNAGIRKSEDWFELTEDGLQEVLSL